jgi:hypothetical protein
MTEINNLEKAKARETIATEAITKKEKSAIEKLEDADNKLTEQLFGK